MVLAGLVSLRTRRFAADSNARTDYFNNLYLHNGTWFFVSNKPEAAGFPTQSQGGVRFILTDVSEGSTKGVPGDDMFRVVSTKEARGILGGVAIRKTGVSVSCTAKTRMGNE